MELHLFGPDMNDVRKSLFRKTPEGVIDLAAACRFYNGEDGELILLYASGVIWQANGMILAEFLTIIDGFAYVMALDEETMIWTVITQDPHQQKQLPPPHVMA